MRYVLILLVSLLLFLVSCKKDTTISNVLPLEMGDTCLLNNDTSQSPYYKSSNDNWQFPVFNPNNNNEFAYVREVGLRKSKLMVYNIVTKKSKELVTIQNPWGYLDWSVKGWIIFMAYNRTLWKIKEDGTGLQQLVSNYISTYARFNKTGEKIIFNGQDAASSNTFIIDEQGNYLDSFKYGVNDPNVFGGLHLGRGDWSEDDKIATFSNASNGDVLLYYIDLNLKKNVFVINLGNSYELGVKRCYWYPGNQDIMLVGSNGIYKVNISTGVLGKVYGSYCRKRYLENLSVSNDGTKMLTMLSRARLLSPTVIFTWYSIGLIDLQDSTDVDIELP